MVEVVSLAHPLADVALHRCDDRRWLRQTAAWKEPTVGVRCIHVAGALNDWPHIARIITK